MNSPVIIVRIKNSLKEPVQYLEDSYKNKSSRFYTVGVNDIQIASTHAGLECLAAFVVFEPYDDKGVDKVLKLYIGNASIAADNKGWRINYQISAGFTSDMIINNFVSNSELDLENDFGSQSYVLIEDNLELLNQLKLISQTPYALDAALKEKQEYPPFSREISLHEYSQKNENCFRPLNTYIPDEHRSEFQRDYERIVHARASRRLVDKAQIFTSSKGDHYRTRMTHTLEVAQIARAISLGLNLNTELTEAIALAHDLGHTPFGHQGERTLDEILKGKIDIIKYRPEGDNFYGGFKHNLQGIRVANSLEEKYVEYDGLNLSYQVLEGILKHTKFPLKDCARCKEADSCTQKCYVLDEFLKYEEPEQLYPDYKEPTTLEGQIVKIADEIAQRGHDLDDAFASGTLSVSQLENYLSLNKMKDLRKPLEAIDEDLLNAKKQNRVFVSEDEMKHTRIVSTVIGFFIKDVINQSRKNMTEFKPDDLYNNSHRFSTALITFSKDGKILCDYLEKIISKKVISSSEVVRFDEKGKMIVAGLFKAYYKNPKLLHKGTLRRILINMRQHTKNVIDFVEGDSNEVREEIKRIVNSDFNKMDDATREEYTTKNKILVRAIVDYISGMTDSYAINEYNSLYN